MGVQETNISKRVQKALSKLGTRLFRVNTGFAWAGVVKKKFPNGDILLGNAYPMRMGLVNGGSDLIGWHPVIITQAMVGKRVAVFAAPEVKTDTGSPNPDQVTFIRVVTEAGGIAGVVRSAEDAEALIAAWLS